jgi:hypothetical protein
VLSYKIYQKPLPGQHEPKRVGFYGRRPHVASASRCTLPSTHGIKWHAAVGPAGSLVTMHFVGHATGYTRQPQPQAAPARPTASGPVL